uniref:Uncharacterized protein n=1 Tax=Paramormyrops kingsleyae TaxID=1676925 RepID=A0A3B3RCL5_9TELE
WKTKDPTEVLVNVNTHDGQCDHSDAAARPVEAQSDAAARPVEAQSDAAARPVEAQSDAAAWPVEAQSDAAARHMHILRVPIPINTLLTECRVIFPDEPLGQKPHHESCRQRLRHVRQRGNLL